MIILLRPIAWWITMSILLGGCNVDRSGVDYNRAAPLADESLGNYRYDAALSLTAPTSAERETLIELLDNEDAYFYALIALARIKDRSTVPFIGEKLLQEDNRYFALTLGAIGDRAAIPYLRQAIRDTEHSFVRKNAVEALRMLGDRSANHQTPDPTNDSPVRIRIKIAEPALRLGETTELQATLINDTEQSIAMSRWMRQSLHAVSSDGDHITKRSHGTVFSIPSKEDFLVVEPGEHHTLSLPLELDVGKPGSDTWTEEVLPERTLYLTASSFAGWDIARFAPERPIPLKLVIVYDPGEREATAKDLGVEGYWLGEDAAEADPASDSARHQAPERDKVISNTVHLTCIASEPDGDDAAPQANAGR